MKKQTTKPKAKTLAQRRAKLRGRSLPNGRASYTSKLDDEIEKRICGIIASGPVRHEDACSMCGISRQTFYNWRALGAAEPNSRYGKFLEEVSKAETIGRMRCEKKLIEDPDWKAIKFLMANRWPDLYRESFALRQEISGPGGAPVPVSITPFVVEIKCDESLEKLDFGPIIDKSNSDSALKNVHE